MDLQTLIVGLILLSAIIYVAKLMLGKIKSFTPQNKNCGDNCNCQK